MAVPPGAPPWAARAIAAPLALISRARGKSQVSDRIIERARLWGAQSPMELYGEMMSFAHPLVQPATSITGIPRALRRL